MQDLNYLFSKETHDRLVRLDDRPTDKDLTFEESAHTYTYKGKVLKSITQLLSEKKLSPDYTSVDNELLTKSATRGNEIHKAIEEWIKYGKTSDKTEVINFISWLDNGGYQVVGSEVIVHNDNYAGTIDLIVYDTLSRKLIIIDIKTTSVIHTDSVEWQTSLYANLDTFANDKDQWGGYDLNGCIHFAKNGDLEYKELKFKNIYAVDNLLSLGLVPVIDLDPTNVKELVNALKQIDLMEQKLSSFQSYINEQKEKLCIAMEENGVKSYENKDIKVIYIAPTTRNTVDSNKLKEEYKEIYDKVTKTTTAKASVRITIKEEDNGDEE